MRISLLILAACSSTILRAPTENEREAIYCVFSPWVNERPEFYDVQVSNEPSDEVYTPGVIHANGENYWTQFVQGARQHFAYVQTGDQYSYNGVDLIDYTTELCVQYAETLEE